MMKMKSRDDSRDMTFLLWRNSQVETLYAIAGWESTTTPLKRWLTCRGGCCCFRHRLRSVFEDLTPLLFWTLESVSSLRGVGRCSKTVSGLSVWCWSFV